MGTNVEEAFQELVRVARRVAALYTMALWLLATLSVVSVTAIFVGCQLAEYTVAASFAASLLGLVVSIVLGGPLTGQAIESCRKRREGQVVDVLVAHPDLLAELATMRSYRRWHHQLRKRINARRFVRAAVADIIATALHDGRLQDVVATVRRVKSPALRAADGASELPPIRRAA